MSDTLPPILNRRLQETNRRCLRLATVRGLCRTICLAILALLATAAVDYFWLLENSGRWLLGSVFYAVLFFSAWWFLRPSWIQRSPAMLARLLEQLQPTLKEKLQPAVELNSATPGSSAFRDRVREDAERLIEPVRIADLLPWRQISRWLHAVWIGLACLAVLMILAADTLPLHLARVLLPAADLGRPSPTRFLAQDPGKIIIAPGESVTFDVQLERPARWYDQPVTLQWRIGEELQPPLELQTVHSAENERTDVDRLQGRIQQHFALTRTIDQTLSFRFVADGAQTRWQSIRAIPRPTISQYGLKVAFPDYAQWPAIAWDSEQGDMTTVAGSRFHLQVQTDQALSEAQLEWHDLKSSSFTPQTVMLSSQSPTLWSLEREVTGPARYRFQGLGLESGLASEFSSLQQLTVVEDAPARLQWLTPTEHQRTTPAQGLLELELGVEDEFPVDRLELQRRIDRRYWESIRDLEPVEIVPDPTSAPSRRQEACRFQIDLMDWRLQPGQMVEFRVLAVDRKGQPSESPLLTYLISEIQLDWSVPPEVKQRLSDLRAVSDFVQEFSDIENLLTQSEGNLDSSEHHREARRRLQQALDAESRATQTLVASLKQSLSRSQNPIVGDELERWMEWLQTRLYQTLPEIRQALNEDSDASNLPAMLQRTRESHSAAPAFLKEFRHQVEHDLLDDLGSDLFTARQFALQHSKQLELGSVSWQRELQLLERHLREVALKMLRYAEVVPEERKTHVADWAQWTAEMADRAENLRQPDQENDQLQRPYSDFLQQFDYRQMIAGLAGDSIPYSIRIRNATAQKTGEPAALIRGMTQQLKSTAAQDTVRLDWLQRSLQLLEKRRENQYQRAGGNPQHAADLGYAYRAVLNRMNSDVDWFDHETRTSIVDRWEEFAEATSILQMDQRLFQADQLLQQLKQRERFQSHTFSARIESVRQFEGLVNHLAQMAEKADSLKLTDQERKALRDLRWAEGVGLSNKAIGQRRWDPNYHASANLGLEQLQRDLDIVRSQLAEAFANARQRLRDANPETTELAKAAAAIAGEKQIDATRLEKLQREASIPNRPQQLATQFQDQLEPQAELQQLEMLLQDQAASQDLLDSQKREAALQADIARIIVSHARQQIEESLSVAAAATDNQAAKALQALAQTEMTAQQTLQRLAEQMEQEQPRTEDLLALAQETGALSPEQPALQQDYETAEALSELQQETTEQLIEQLEAELRVSQPMQRELSEISEAIARQSQQVLEQAAADEQQMMQQNESSDLNFQFEKNQLERDLNQMAEEGANLAHLVRTGLAESAGQLEEDEHRETLQQAARDLQAAAEAARNIRESDSFDQMQQQAEALADATENLLPKLSAIEKLAGERTVETPHEDANLWQQARNRSQETQNRLHQDNIRRNQNLERDLENQLKRDQRTQQLAERESRAADQRLQQAQQQAEKNQGQTWAEDQLREAQRNQAKARQAEQLADQNMEQQKTRIERVQQHRQALEKDSPQPLEQQHPLAEMTEGLAGRLRRQAQQLNEQAQARAQQKDWQNQLQSDRQTLARNANQQQQIRNSVQRAAEDLQRASDHEQRLGNPTNAESLENLAQQVRKTQESTMAQAQTGMEQAGEEQAPVEDRQASIEQSQQIQQQLQQAGQELNQQANQLQQTLDQTNGTNEGLAEAGQDSAADTAGQASDDNNQPTGAQQAQSNQPSASQPGRRAQQNASPSSGSPDSSSSNLASLSPAEKAQLLDQLTQKAASRETGRTPANSADTLTQAAQQLASRMSQMRQQNPSSTQPQPGQPSDNAQPSSLSQVQTMEGDVGGQPDVGRPTNIDPVRLNGDWSLLREQSAEEVSETQRDRRSPRYQKQVETYFELLSRRRGSSN